MGRDAVGGGEVGEKGGEGVGVGFGDFDFFHCFKRFH